MTSTDDLLHQTKRALDEFDDVPLDVSIRRAVRLATLLGETETAIRLSFELRSSGGGSIRANRTDIERLMREGETWEGGPDAPHERAVAGFLDDRVKKEDKDKPPGGRGIHVQSITELQSSIERMTAIADTQGSFGENQRNALSSALEMTQIVERVRHRTFSALLAFERRLTFADTNEDIYRRFHRSVEGVLATHAPHILDAFNAVYRRLREADSAEQATEELAQAVTTCRRILKAVADIVYPPEADPSQDDHALDDERYRNRLKEWTKGAILSKSLQTTVGSLVGGLYERFVALDGLASKGVHADLARQEADLCALSTYIVAGEILRLAAGPSLQMDGG